MKKLFTLLALIVTIAIFAQAPQGFNYQATVRNSSGALIVNQNVYFKFNILLNSQTSVPIYTETHYVATDGLGQVNLVVGQGTATVGIFSSINWANGSYYLGIEINTGSGYVAVGTTQLLSVPYALYANRAGNSNSNLPNGTNIGDTLNWIWNGSAWVPTSSIATSQLPVVTTGAVGDIPCTNFKESGGSITSDGGYSITSKGICWSVNPNPTINNNSTNDGTGASGYTSIFTNLLPTTTYYYRAYATNSIGTGYGITYTFTTSANPVNPPPVTDIDGNTYQTVKICDQTWTTTNLNVTKYRNGDVIPQVTDPTEWANLTEGAWCYYNNDPANEAVYGKLYNWYAVNDPRGLAPIGYHIPSESEWTSLNNSRFPLKETGTTHWTSPNNVVTSTIYIGGFNALPGGIRMINGTFETIGTSGNWWSSDRSSITSGSDYLRAVSFSLSNVSLGGSTNVFYKIRGLSLRCLKD
jgi:uncharacterized protein (TIGR02145 family)